MLPLVPIGIAALAGGAWWAKSKREKANADPVVNAQRQAIFDTAINKVHDGAKLRELAKVFAAQGLLVESAMLVKRAELSEASPELKAARQAAYRKGMASTDPAAVRVLANAMNEMGAMGAAKNLRDYADALDSAQLAEEAATELGDS